MIQQNEYLVQVCSDLGTNDGVILDQSDKVRRDVGKDMVHFTVTLPKNVRVTISVKKDDPSQIVGASTWIVKM